MNKRHGNIEYLLYTLCLRVSVFDSLSVGLAF